MATAQVVRSTAGIHNILLAIDFSHQSDNAIKYALEFGHQFGAHTEIVYVMPTDEFALAGPDGLQLGRDAARRDLLELKRKLERYDSFGDGSEHGVSMLEGPVADSLLECARERHVDLIVVGTHGRAGLSKILLGSVAEKIFRHSRVPVLTIGPNVHYQRTFGATPSILVPCDLSPKSHPAVEYACELAKTQGAILTVLHVVEQSAEGLKADPERVTQAIEEKLMAIVGASYQDLDVHYRIESGNVASTILEAASDDTDLIVLGVRPASGVLDRFMWPIAYELVREARCPVVTVRGALPARGSGKNRGRI